MVKVLLAGGGTAGHVNPALAIAEIIKEHRPDAEFLFAGTPFGLEARLIPKAGYAFTPIKVKGFQRRLTLKNIGRNIKAAYYLAFAGAAAKKIIEKFKPDLVIGTGGYVSGPVVMKAVKMGIKTAIHEQNAYPGVTTRLLSKKVDKVMLTVEEAKKYLDTEIEYTVTGLPVRSGFKNITKEEARKQLGLDNSICILSSGGSLGAGRINETVADLMAWYDGNMLVNHIHSFGGMGKNTFLKDLESKGVDIKKNKRLTAKEYIDNMPVCMAAADLVISRCGANSLYELQSMGRGSILIPSPIVAGNHQYYNGKVLEKAGAAIVIEQKNLTSELLIKTVKELCEDPQKLKALSENARRLCINDTSERIYSVLSGLIN
ncbi:MAG: undecaprenyldiphospho-muramoylpentapeptide beta-N-acetylglucosaminyltransferase [Oscillospiraceae bacterium]|jgi:UDP-N-acetylglucosamine--N-acetylmuramyl-(pentapeptide) pyrophosphoryl-undecaprenol N-acetylglucosamine transferase